MTNINLGCELSISDVGVVVCTRNAATMIEKCLQSLRDCGVGEIVLVDGQSNDETIKLASKFADLILEDSGQGLGNARNMGILCTKSKYILNCGPDNIVNKEALVEMLAQLQLGYDGVGAKTEMRVSSYLSWAMNEYKKSRYYFGERSVIGTPSLFDGNKLRSNPFNINCQHSDDSELCERWSGKFNSKFLIADVIVYEIGQENMLSIKRRWKNYGYSDHEIYKSHKNIWTLKRRLVSIFHPMREELFKPFFRMGLLKGVVAIPFLLMITAIRYYYWTLFSIKHSINAD